MIANGPRVVRARQVAGKETSWLFKLISLEKPKMFVKLINSSVYKYIKLLLSRYKDADLGAMSAQVTYYLILAFFPFVFFLINLLSFTSLSNRLLIANFNVVLPNDTAVLIKNLLVETIQTKSATFLFLGMLGSLWAASRGMAAIIRGLNHSYGIKESRSLIKLIFIELGSTIGLTVMIIFSFFMIIFGRILGAYLFGAMGEEGLFHNVWPFMRYSISFIVMFVAFHLIYKYLPNRRSKSKNVLGVPFLRLLVGLRPLPCFLST